MKVYVGYDTREDIAYQVCEHSIKRRNGETEVIALESASEALRADPEVVMAAVKSWVGALEFASDELKSDKELMMLANKPFYQ